MNVFAKFDEIPSMTLQDIKEQNVTDTLSFVRTDGRTDGWTDGQRENSIPSHKHSLRGGGIMIHLDYRLAINCMYMKKTFK